MDDPFHLSRFVEAQAPVYDSVLAELRAGRKRTHWIWFIFPQMAGLGRSRMAQDYAIASRAEAAAYLAHPLLEARLRQCAGLVLAIDGRTIGAVFASPDDMKFQSSMTLFAAVADDKSLFQACLDKYFGGVADAATLDRL
ncbi:MAG: DUF1810 domain-containing protein [Pseudomonadota bacterium]